MSEEPRTGCEKCKGLGMVDPRDPVQAAVEDADLARLLRGIGSPPKVPCVRCNGRGLLEADGAQIADATEKDSRLVKCSDCGRDIRDATLDGACGERGGHEARCTCQPIYRAGYIFPGPPGYAGLALGRDCPIHTPAPTSKPDAEKP